MPRNLPNNLRKVIVVRENRTSIAITTQRFGREETGARYGADVATFATFIFMVFALLIAERIKELRKVA